MKYPLVQVMLPPGAPVLLKSSGAAGEAGSIPVKLLMQAEGLPQTYPVAGANGCPSGGNRGGNILAEMKGEMPETAYHHEISMITDKGDEDSIRLHCGVWNDELYRLQKGALRSRTMEINDRCCRAKYFLE